MPIHNSEIASVLSRLADLLEIEGANQFRVRAYRHAAGVVTGLPENVQSGVEQGRDLTELEGIGKDLAAKIEEIALTGTLKQLNALESRVPSGLLQLLRLESLGPKRVKALHENLKIKSLQDLETAAEHGRIRQLVGFGQKTEEKIRNEIERIKQEHDGHRFLLAQAEEIIAPLLVYLRGMKGVHTVDPAGSLRRRRESVGDVDILVTAAKNVDVIRKFTEYDEVADVIAKGPAKSSVRLRRGLQIDLRLVRKESYGAALLYFTGSKEHSLKLRRIAQRQQMKINEYGVYRGEKSVAGRTEEDMYRSLELPWIPPELREDRGEIEAARENRLPRLIELSDMKGDLQSHTTASDGHNTLAEMAEGARAKGYEYLAITDHSKKVTIANGLDERRLRREIEQINRFNENFGGRSFRVLRSVEVDILEDGSLDLPDSVLKELDIVVCSIHYYTRLSREKQTARVIRAMDNPNFHIWAHPTGRIIGGRPPYDVDLEAVFRKAAQVGCFVELNAHANRLDLNDVYVRMARDMGVKVAISTDAHSVSDLNYMRYGIGQARRGWLEAKDVINTRSWKELKKLLRKR